MMDGKLSEIALVQRVKIKKKRPTYIIWLGTGSCYLGVCRIVWMLAKVAY